VLWVNWSTSKDSYEAGKKIQKCDITFSARIPEPFSCDVLTPPQP
jgi:hypothetical protein